MLKSPAIKVQRFLEVEKPAVYLMKYLFVGIGFKKRYKNSYANKI